MIPDLRVVGGLLLCLASSQRTNYAEAAASPSLHRGFEKTLSILRPEQQNSRRHLQTCNLEDEFYYDTSLEMRVFGVDGGSLGCSTTDLAGIGDTLTVAHTNVINVDPRLEDVIELLVNMCEDATEIQRRKLNFIHDYAASYGSGSGYGFNWGGSGRCRWCPPDDGDCDHGCRLRRRLKTLMESNSNEEVSHSGRNIRGGVTEERRLSGVITAFKLYDTSTETNPQFLREIEHGDIIDIQQYGDKLTIEAEGENLQRIVFGLDNEATYQTEWHAPYLLDGNGGNTFHTTSAFSNVGTHTITATPYDLSSGSPLAATTFSFLIVDGQTNAGNTADPGSREELINMLEDDLGFYLSGVINHMYFFESGHCLENNLVWVKVELTEVNQGNTVCSTDNIPTAAPTASPISAGRIKNRNSDKCVEIPGGSTADNEHAKQYTCSSSRSGQLFSFIPVDGTYYQIQAIHSAKCLAVEGATTLSDQDVVQLPCTMDDHMLWEVEDNGSYKQLKAKHSGKCMDVLYRSTYDGAEIHQDICENRSELDWIIDATVPTPTASESNPGTIESTRFSGKCIDVDGGSVSTGSQIVQWDCIPNRQSQKWVLVPIDSEHYQIKADNTNLCMGVEGADTGSDADIVLYSCGTDDNMLWKVTGSGADRIIQAKHSSMCMDIYASSTANGGKSKHCGESAPIGSNQSRSF